MFVQKREERTSVFIELDPMKRNVFKIQWKEMFIKIHWKEMFNKIQWKESLVRVIQKDCAPQIQGTAPQVLPRPDVSGKN